MSERESESGVGLWKVAGVLLVAAVLVWPMWVSARDADGSRVGARPQKVGTTAEDELTPPDDGSDWRYFEVEKARSYRVTLTHEPSKATVSLALTRATGETVDSADSSEGDAELEASLEPGLYYVEVASEAAISYSVTIK